VTNNKTIFPWIAVYENVDDGLEETAVTEIGLYDNIWRLVAE
jgi:hypothetical protein